MSTKKETVVAEQENKEVRRGLLIEPSLDQAIEDFVKEYNKTAPAELNWSSCVRHVIKKVFIDNTKLIDQIF